MVATTPSKLFNIHFLTDCLLWVLIENSAFDLPRTELLEQLSCRSNGGKKARRYYKVNPRAFMKGIIDKLSPQHQPTVVGGSGVSCACHSEGLMSFQKLQLPSGGQHKLAEAWVLAAKMQA